VVKAALQRYRSLLLPAGSGDGDITDVTIAVTSADDTLSDASDFSYSITATGTVISATAASPFGVAYALESLSQLMDKGEVKCSALAVIDSPRFVHRGLMIGRFFSCGPTLHTTTSAYD
jgi:N-acetyl-beta-hexosaminidase